MRAARRVLGHAAPLRYPFAMRTGLGWGVAALVLAAACDETIDATPSPSTTDASADQADGSAPAPVPAPFGLDARPANPTCVAPKRPTLDTGVKLVTAFPGITFTGPLKMLQAPGDPSNFYVVERGSGATATAKVKVLPKTAKSAADVKDFATLSVNATGEGGLLSMAFHPDWQKNHTVFFSYTRTFSAAKGDTIPKRPNGTAEPQSGLTSVIAKAVSTDGGLTVGAPVEILTRSQPYTNHDGGDMAFGPDGYLYFGFGDGGSGNDPEGSGQRLDTVLGKMIRIDVDGAAPYTIPKTNPFASSTGTEKKEIFAWGLRNPWRWSFDRATGDLWLGDVGQSTWEEIDKIELGGNYGWTTCEGFHKRGDTQNLCATPGLRDPIVEHPRSEASSITGGYVYRGKAIPSLIGAYVYGDFVSGNVWAIPDGVKGKPTPILIATKMGNLAAFAEDADGELYTVQLFGPIQKLVPAATPAPSTFPDKLSKTGCVDPAHPTVPATGLIPYAVRSPLWSDGAEKARWLALPDGAQITVAADGDFQFPVGTVLMKEFSLGGKRIETRLFMLHDDGQWGGYSYEWDDAESDATLLPAGKVRDLGAGASWTYPSRTQCFQCHTDAAGGSLGLEIGQLNGDFVYSTTNRVSNQLATLEHLGLFVAPVGDPSLLVRLPVPRAEGPVDARARSYLHANCSHCHRPGGNGKGSMDLRFATPAAATKTCGAVPEEGSLGIADAKIVAPGEPQKSVLSLRFHASDATRMPPVGVRKTDPDGAALLDDWVKSTTKCP